MSEDRIISDVEANQLTAELLKEVQQKASPYWRIALAKRTEWLTGAFDHQKPPEGEPWGEDKQWGIWLMLAGRGAGKTRTAAEQLWWWAWENPKTRWLVSAPTSMDVRATCFEGESGLMAVIPPILIRDYNKALHEIVLINGSLIKGISASEPDRFRGGQYHGAWLDELAAWDYLDEAWYNIQFAVRLKKADGRTQVIATTTPRPKDLIVELIGREGDDVAITTASTYVNLANLAPSFQKQILAYEGTQNVPVQRIFISAPIRFHPRWF